MGWTARTLWAAVLAVVSAQACAAGDWVSDWFDQSATTSAGSFQTQSRGYYTGGSFQGRLRMSNDYPLSVSPPRFQAGCGGVDLFLGGFSYLDPEYLVAKFERVIQAAPAFAFDMAMQEYCKVCSSTMQTMTEITDYLNSIQVNDCRMAKQIAAIPMKGDMNIFKDSQEKAMQGYAILSGQSKNSQAVNESVQSNNGASPVDTREIVAECPQAFKDVFTGGSVVKNMAGMMSLAPYADLTRGLIGDVQVNWNASLKSYAIQAIEPCPGNDQLDTNDLMTGRLEKKNIGGTCTVATSQSVVEAVETKLTAIAGKLAAGGSALLPEELTFINNAPFPLLNLMRDAVAARNVPETIAAISEPLASAYSFKMLDDLHKLNRMVLSKASEVGQTQVNATGNPMKCDVGFLKPAIERIGAMDDLTLKYRELARANYHKERAELAVNLQFASELLKQRQQTVRDNGASLK